MSQPYTYVVRGIIRVVDGDTVDAVITFGFGINAAMRFRLSGVDAAERYTDEGKQATAFTQRWLNDHFDPFGDAPLLVSTQKGAQSTVGIGDGAFGRWLGDFHHNGEHLNAALIEEFGTG